MEQKPSCSSFSHIRWTSTPAVQGWFKCKGSELLSFYSVILCDSHSYLPRWFLHLQKGEKVWQGATRTCGSWVYPFPSGKQCFQEILSYRFFIIMLARTVLDGHFSYNNNTVRRFYCLPTLLLFLTIFCFSINWGNILDIKTAVSASIVTVKSWSLF